MFSFITAGESHGQGLVAVVGGIPAGLPLSADFINADLARRQLGFGRGGRMKIERDQAQIISGVRHGLTLGSPIALLIGNRDWANWESRMSVEPSAEPPEPALCPRPGHADLSGLLKTGQKDVRNILERASARETAARTAAGAVARRLLDEVGLAVLSHVTRIGEVQASLERRPGPDEAAAVDASVVRCFDGAAAVDMVAAIKAAAANQDTLGGVFEVLVYNCLPGIGGYVQWDERLNANFFRALGGIPAIKGVEVGDGFALAAVPGSRAHDEIHHDPAEGYRRRTNRAGGIEGGMSNGAPIVLRAAMKPIPTLGAGLRTVNIETKEPAVAMSERSDICAVPAAAVIGEAVVCLELCRAFLEKFGGDSLREFKRNVDGYLKQISES
jgi:chorismate synthase